MLEYLSATLLLLGAVYALGARELMRGVVGVAVSFLGLAGLFWHLGAYYLAVAQVFIFVGGVVTLFVLAFNVSSPSVQKKSGWPGILLASVLLVIIGLLIPFHKAQPAVIGLRELAEGFFMGYGWLLNVAIVLLLAGVVAAQYILEVLD